MYHDTTVELPTVLPKAPIFQSRQHNTTLTGGSVRHSRTIQLPHPSITPQPSALHPTPEIDHHTQARSHIDRMDPSRNLALHNAKLRTILSNLQSVPRQGSSPTAPNPELESERDIDMPPPAYHTVVDPAETLPEMMHRLYDTVEEEDEKNGETPEININATTQIRGHGNIISIAQMDSMRIANLLAILIHGGIPPNAQAQPQGQPANAPAPAPAPATAPEVAQRPAQERRELPKINININCGATVIGDRNIVGPGLGDIARHMQLAQQRQQAQQQQQQQQQSQANLASKMAQPQRPVFGYPALSQATLATPPMSRSSSFGSEGSAGTKRKAEEPPVEEPVKRERRL
ncbi:uncharacterized protein N0V89_005107 [Didymosphaeria variabile]|uniref:Uncharacterized protein n=1 Tax=Didymosphaeria variabile TaxID=1932322 RepID=A0A9W9CBG2_9PLEO|nr:uncharacterized protein N0V89_005107 [Didymosphaeria variabile]KAJ4353378.1 hypothetical protein N0V89_005107 [Didymosphaeria variabile]